MANAPSSTSPLARIPNIERVFLRRLAVTGCEQGVPSRYLGMRLTKEGGSCFHDVCTFDDLLSARQHSKTTSRDPRQLVQGVKSSERSPVLEVLGRSTLEEWGPSVVAVRDRKQVLAWRQQECPQRWSDCGGPDLERMCFAIGLKLFKRVTRAVPSQDEYAGEVRGCEQRTRQWSRSCHKAQLPSPLPEPPPPQNASVASQGYTCLTGSADPLSNAAKRSA